MRLRKIALTAGSLAIVGASFWLTLTALRHINSTEVPAKVQTATRIPLDSFYVNPGCLFSGASAERLLTTLPQQGAFALTAPLPFPPGSTAPGKIRARLQVLEGRLSILVLEKIGEGQPITEKAVNPTGELVQVDVDLPEVARARLVVLRNVSANGTRARARIISIEAIS
jgi:hypothetical protein